MSQLPRTWEPKKGAGDTTVQKASKNTMEESTSQEDQDKEKEPCCRQVGLAKMTPQQLSEWKAGLLAAQPKLTAKEIRRFRMKYCHVICLELEEEGLPESAAYIRFLLQMNVNMRRAAGPDSLMWQKPKLRDNQEYLDRLREGLTEAERAHQDERPGEQCSALLSVAVFFMLKEEAWWWVAEQLFLWVVTVAEQFKADGGRREAITRYIYGLFLLKQLDDVETARQQLQTARALSAGKEWDAGKELGRPQESVFREACGLLYKALIAAAQQCREDDPPEAIRLCASALRRARDSNHLENEAEALYELGLSYQAAGEDVKSLEILTEYLAMCRELHDPQGLCNAHLEMAICFKNLSDTAATFKHLESFLHVADVHYLTERKAEANRYLGEYHLNMGNYNQASTHFSTSFSLYFKMSMMEETEQVRGLQGIAAGHQLMPVYTSVLLLAHASSRHMTSLLRWKEVHRPFWERSECSLSIDDDEDNVLDKSGSGAQQDEIQDVEGAEKPAEEVTTISNVDGDGISDYSQYSAV